MRLTVLLDVSNSPLPLPICEVITKTRASVIPRSSPPGNPRNILSPKSPNPSLIVPAMTDDQRSSLMPSPEAAESRKTKDGANSHSYFENKGEAFENHTPALRRNGSQMVEKGILAAARRACFLARFTSKGRPLRGNRVGACSKVDRDGAKVDLCKL